MKSLSMVNKSKGNVRNGLEMVSIYPGLKSRITPFNSRIWSVITPMLFVVFGLFGVNESAWGNTLSIETSGFQSIISNNTVSLGGNHVAFYLNGNGNSITYGAPSIFVASEIKLGAPSKGNSITYKFDYSNLNTNHSIKVTKVQVYGLSQASGTMSLNGETATAVYSGNNSYTEVKTENTTNGLAFPMNLVCKNTRSTNGTSQFFIQKIIITYEITPPAPSVTTSTGSVNVTLNAGTPTNMDVSGYFSSDAHFGRGYTIATNPGDAGHLSGSNFYATDSGEYVVKARYTAEANCHEASAWSGALTVTVNPLTPTLTYDDGTVDVSVNSTDKVTLNLKTLKKTYTGNGAISYSILSGTGGTILQDTLFYATQTGDFQIVASSAATKQYSVKKDTFTVTVNKRTPTFVWQTPAHIYSGAELTNLAQAQYNGNDITSGLTYKYKSNNTTAAVVASDSVTINVPTTGFITNQDVTISVKTAETDYYLAGNSSHDYLIEPKKTPVFQLDGVTLNEDVTIDLLIGETASMSFSNIDETEATFVTPSSGDYVTYVHDSEAHTGVITATAFGNQTLQFQQQGNDTIFGLVRSVTVRVKKHPVTLTTTLDGGTWLVDSIYAGAVYSVNAPEEGEPAQASVSVTSSNESGLRYVDGAWKAVGEANDVTLTIRQAANDYWEGDTITATIDVIKHTPVITWQMENSYPWGAIIGTPVLSSNEEIAFSLTSSDATIANWVNGQIEVYNKEGDVTFTLAQDGNYKWSAASTNLTKTIHVFQPQNHVPFTIGNSNKGDIATVSDSRYVVWDTDGYKMGDNKIILKNAPDAYVVLQLSGVPDSLLFTKTLDEYCVLSACSYPVDDQCLFEVYESTTNGNWGDPIFSYNKQQVSKDTFALLSASTKFVKLRYYGTVYGHFNNIKVTERKGIDVPATYDFGTGYVGNTATERDIDVEWYNVKNCTVSIDDETYFTLDDESESFTTKLDSFGVAPIHVTYSHEVYGTHTATMTITSSDTPAKTATITLTGTTDKAIQSIIWREDITPLPLDEPYEDAAYATSGLDVVLTAEKSDIVRISNDTIEGIGVGTTKVYAYQAGDSKWATVRDTIEIEVTNKHIQHIVWNDKLNNIKCEEGKTVTKTLTAASDSLPSLPITYELDDDADDFASVDDNILTITGWGSGYITARQAGNEDYVGVSKKVKLVSRDPNADCKPLVLDEPNEKTLHTVSSKEYTLNGEPWQIEFDAKCNATAVNGLYVGEYYDKAWHQVAYIPRTGDNSITSSESHFGPFDLHENATKVKLYTELGATMTRTYRNVEVSTARYLRLKTNEMDFSAVQMGQTVDQQFYINYSNITGALDVELKHASTQFVVITETVGEDCGDIDHNAAITIRFTGRTLGTENDTIVISNKKQRLEVPVSATVTQQTQVITWNQSNPANYTALADDVQLTATATSGEEVTFASSDDDVAEAYRKDNGEWWLDIKKGGTITVTASQAGNARYAAAPSVGHSYVISRIVPEITTVPTASALTKLNPALSNSALTGGVATVDGSFAWESPETEATIGNSGYTVVFTPDNTDVYETVTCTVVVVVSMAGQEITWDFNVTEMPCDANYTFDATASSGLAVRYVTSDNTIAYVDGSNKLHIVRGGDVTITAKQDGDEQYAAAPDVEKSFHISQITPQLTVPTAAPVRIGKLLDDATLSGGVATSGNTSVDGIFSWVDGSTTVMNVAGTFTKTVIFTPSNTNYYATVSCAVEVTVVKFAPKITHTLSASDITYGQPLSASTLSGTCTATDTVTIPNETVEGTYAWRDATEIVNAGTPTKAVVRFTPAESAWYNTVDFEVSLNVAQASPVLNVTASDIMTVQTLSESVLTNNGTAGVCAWDESLDAETSTYSAGDHEGLAYVFTSSDPNYTDGSGTVTLHVISGYVITGDDWANSENWTGGTVPATDDANVLVTDSVTIGGDVTIGSLTIEEGATVVVTGSLTITGGESVDRDNHGSIHVENGGTVTIEGDAPITVENFTIEASLGGGDAEAASGQVSGEANLQVSGDVFFKMSFDPSGSISYGWYDFVVPFEVDVLNGIYDEEGNKLTNNVDYAIMTFSESKRAVNGKSWSWFTGTLQPGRLYSITLDEGKDWNTFLFKKKANATIGGSKTYGAVCTSAGESEDRGWNGMGNGTLQHCQLNSLPAETKIQVYDHVYDRYVQREAAEYTYAIGTAFFVQVASAQNIDLTSVNENRGFLAPARTAARVVNEFRLGLTAEGATRAADQIWVSASEEATGEYVIGHDLTKMGTPTDSKVAQMWTIRDNMLLSDNEMPLTGEAAECVLGLYSPKKQHYTLEVEKEPGDADLYLTYNDNVIWDLTAAPYELDLNAGTTNGYGLRIEPRKAPQVTTGVDNTDDEQPSAASRKVIIDNKMYIITPEGVMYDATGKKVW